MREKRTDVDWSKHVLTETHGETLIHRLCIPGTVSQSLTFINTQGVMAVTGDYGNWIFCREFHPSPDGSVSDMYWLGKLRNSSCQDPSEFDSDEVKRQVKELKENHELSAEEIEWLDSLESAADDGEYAFIAEAMNHPGNFDTEMIPNGKVTQWWLLVVFDAFDEICRRLQAQQGGSNA